METGRGERAMADSGWGKDIHAGEVGAEFDRGTGRLVHVLLLAIVAFFVAFFAWAAHAPLDVITRGEAEIVPYGQVKVVQHLEGGIIADILVREGDLVERSEEHTSELQSLMRISYAVFCLKKKTKKN